MEAITNTGVVTCCSGSTPPVSLMMMPNFDCNQPPPSTSFPADFSGLIPTYHMDLSSQFQVPQSYLDYLQYPINLGGQNGPVGYWCYISETGTWNFVQLQSTTVIVEQPIIVNQQQPSITQSLTTNQQQPKLGPPNESITTQINMVPRPTVFVDSSEEPPKLAITNQSTITVILKHNVHVELTVNRNVRLCLNGRFAMSSHCQRSNGVTALVHPKACLFQDPSQLHIRFTEPSRFGEFSQTTHQSDYVHLFEGGIYICGNCKIPPPELDADVSLKAFLYNAQFGADKGFLSQCNRQVQSATHRACRDGSNYISFNGVKIRQFQSGSVAVYEGDRYLWFCPETGACTLRTRWISIVVRRNGVVEVKYDGKRITNWPQSGIQVIMDC